MRKASAIFVLVFALALFAVAPARALVVFTDNFSGDLSNWTVMSGSWSIVGGELSQSVVDFNYECGQIAINGLSLKDLHVEADVKFVELKPNEWAYAGFAVRYLDENTFYWIVLKQSADENGLPNSNVPLELRAQFSYLVVVDLGFVAELGTSYKLKAEVVGDSFKIYVNDVLKIDAVDTKFGNAGKILMWTGRCSANFDNVIVTNPDSFNAVPEPAPVIVSVLFIAALGTYGLIRKRTGNKPIVKP